jgi:hypothetical protein
MFQKLNKLSSIKPHENVFAGSRNPTCGKKIAINVLRSFWQVPVVKELKWFLVRFMI